MSLTGYNTPTLVDDVGKENPLRAPGHAAEMMGATNAAAASMMALFHRDATGAGPMDRCALLAGDREHLEDRDGGVLLRRNSVQPPARQGAGRARTAAMPRRLHLYAVGGRRALEGA